MYILINKIYFILSCNDQETDFRTGVTWQVIYNELEKIFTVNPEQIEP